MNIQFQPNHFVRVGQFSTTSGANEELKASFFGSVNGDGNFRMKIPGEQGEIVLDILSIKKVQGSNGYMGFSAIAIFPSSFHKIERLGNEDLRAVVNGFVTFKE